MILPMKIRTGAYLMADDPAFAPIYGFIANIYFYDIDTPLKQFVVAHDGLARHCRASGRKLRVLWLDAHADRFSYAMPEAGYLPIPAKLARAGVKDMVRISDARMSGTAFGTIVLHISPEAAVGGPLAFVETGDRIRLSVKHRSLDLLVDGEQFFPRLHQALAAATPSIWPTRGWLTERQSFSRLLKEGLPLKTCSRLMTAILSFTFAPPRIAT